jgi:hypothetical protein
VQTSREPPAANPYNCQVTKRLPSRRWVCIKFFRSNAFEDDDEDENDSRSDVLLAPGF